MEKTIDIGGKTVEIKTEGRLTLENFKAEAGMWLVMDATNVSGRSCAVTWEFSGDGEYISFKMGLLPNLRTRLAVPFALLDGSVLFLPRTPGKLKTVTNGRPMKLENVKTFSLSYFSPESDAKLIVESAYITDAEPEYPLENRPMVDELGQKNEAEWKGKTHGAAELVSYLNSEYEAPLAPMPGRDSYGGDSSRTFEATGYFRVQFDGRRWWLVTPEGGAFFSTGLDCVSIDGDCNLGGIRGLTTGLPSGGEIGWSGWQKDFFSWHKANLHRAFGSEWFEKWADLTKKRMLHWGFNTVACWSDSAYVRRENQPYVFIFNGYPKTDVQIFRDFPDVFSPQFRQSAVKWAAQLSAVSDDRSLIGYFMSNEPQWACVNSLNLAALMLESPNSYQSKEALILFLRARYQNVEELNSAWKTDLKNLRELLNPLDSSALSETAQKDLWDFSAEMVREYIRIPAEEAKKIDPNHLNLGIRYAWLSSRILSAGSEYFDVFSINCYQEDPTETIERTLEFFRKPLIIGEFHFGALDRGLDASGLRRVENQTERGVAFRYYMHRAAAHPFCVGAHYFTLNDQAYLGRFDGENYQIGVVDVCNRPYEEFADAITKTNSELYNVAAGELEPTEERARQLPPVAF